MEHHEKMMQQPSEENEVQVVPVRAPVPTIAENSPYAMFATDKDIEKKGVVIDYGAFSITVARAGGSNVKYTKTVDALSKPYRRAIANETIAPEQVKKIMREAYAKSVVVGWTGMVDATGAPIPFTVQNCIRVFEDLDDLFSDVMEQAQRAALFKKDITEGVVGN